MDTPVLSLTVPEIIEAHMRIMESMGEAPTVLRSEHLLELEVMKPLAAAHHDGADLAKQAAWLGNGISQNQPFLDGNKRVAYVSMNDFLAINDSGINAANLDIARQLVAVTERADSLDAAMERSSRWLRQRLEPRG